MEMPNPPEARPPTRLPLLLAIWTRPSATLAFILSHCPERDITLLLALGGLARVVDRVAQRPGESYLTLLKASPISLFFGALSGWLTLYAYAWGLSVAGRWLGTADADKLRTVLAWALVPVAAALGLVFLYVAIFGEGVWPLGKTQVLPLLRHAENAVLLAQGIASAWTLVILSKGIQLVQGFSPMRTLVNMLLPGILVIAVIFLWAELSKLA